MTETLVAMARADGKMDSEVHIEGAIIKPNAAGVVLIPADHVMAMMLAGYVWSEYPMRNPAQTNS
jgi:hypothetical protein